MSDQRASKSSLPVKTPLKQSVGSRGEENKQVVGLENKNQPLIESVSGSGQKTELISEQSAGEMVSEPVKVEKPTPEIEDFFGLAFADVQAFGELLVEEGDLRGVIGPRELPRLWSRHLVNCAALAQFIPERKNVTVADVGSGAGLPGIVLACQRPEAQFYLIETMERRCDWLNFVIDELGLDNVEVVRARSEDLPKAAKFDYVTSRAVANMTKLLRISGRLVSGRGMMLALKGQRAAAEVEDAKYELKRRGFKAWDIQEVPSVADNSITYVVRATKVEKLPRLQS